VRAAPSPPPCPPPLPRCGRGRGRLAEQGRFSVSGCQWCEIANPIHPSPAVRERGRGWGLPPHLPPAPSSPTLRERRGVSGAEAILQLATIPRSRTRSPLSRSAGEGPGVRAAPSPASPYRAGCEPAPAGVVLRFVVYSTLYCWMQGWSGHIPNTTRRFPVRSMTVHCRTNLRPGVTGRRGFLRH